MTRVELDGRVFFVSRGKRGYAQVKERLVWAAGKPWEGVYDVVRYPTKRNSRPGKFYAQVIAEANRKVAPAYRVPDVSPGRDRGTTDQPRPA